MGSYELDQGELIYVSPNDLRHNRVRDKLYIPLREFVARQRLGEATAETLFEFAPGTVRAPDIAFMAGEGHSEFRGNSCKLETGSRVVGLRC